MSWHTHIKCMCAHCLLCRADATMLSQVILAICNHSNLNVGHVKGSPRSAVWFLWQLQLPTGCHGHAVCMRTSCSYAPNRPSSDKEICGRPSSLAAKAEVCIAAHCKAAPSGCFYEGLQAMRVQGHAVGELATSIRLHNMSNPTIRGHDPGRQRKGWELDAQRAKAAQKQNHILQHISISRGAPAVTWEVLF